MKTLKEMQTTYQVVESCICNKCGKEMQAATGNICGLEAYIEGCYDSPVLEDCTTYEFELCEFCLQELFDAFKIEPKKTEHSA